MTPIFILYLADYLYMVMEFCSGSLRSWLQLRNLNATSVDDRPQLYSWFEDICSGLQYLHQLGERGMVHRDLKPDNILRSTTNRMKISDLGLATDNPYHTHTFGVGTRLYKPDEQMGNEYGKAVDIFPLGNKTHINVSN